MAELIKYTNDIVYRCPLYVVSPSVIHPSTFSNIFSETTTANLTQILYIRMQVQCTKVGLNGPGHMTMMAVTPI